MYLTEDNFFTGFDALTRSWRGAGIHRRGTARPIEWTADTVAITGRVLQKNYRNRVERKGCFARSRSDETRLRIDPDRIYIAGISMGGGGAWYLAPRYPQIWAALATFAGGGDPRQWRG
jgi:S-formylglutathione hydrolase FrmB